MKIINDKLYIGTVVDNNDPLKLFRVRVSIPGLTDQLSNDDLPWYVLNNSISFGKIKGHSSHIIPDVGTEVTISFPWNDIYHGLVTGRYGASSDEFEKITPTDPSIPNLKITEPKMQTDYTSDFRENYPNSAGFLDSLKNWFRLDKLKRTFEVVGYAFNSCKFKIDKDGNITLHITGKLKVVVDSSTSFHCKQAVETIVEGDQRTYVMKERINLTDKDCRDFIRGSHYISEKSK